jgi:prepilin-type N-terminal cleavage/methylation domain-containing protein
MDTIIEDQVTSKRKDKGFTLVELLIVIVILGILATVTVFAVRGITDQGQKSSCDTDKVTLQTAVETFFAQYPGMTGKIPTSAVAVNTAWTTTVVANQQPAIAAFAVPTGITWADGTSTAGANPGATLVKAGLLRAAPTNFYVMGDGTLRYLAAACGVVGVVAG